VVEKDPINVPSDTMDFAGFNLRRLARDHLKILRRSLFNFRCTTDPLMSRKKEETSDAGRRGIKSIKLTQFKNEQSIRISSEGLTRESL
jgi:hypothetical protein